MQTVLRDSRSVVHDPAAPFGTVDTYVNLRSSSVDSVLQELRDYGGQRCQNLS